MTDLTSLRHELADRGVSLLDDATHLAERGAHGAARLADERASTLRSALPDSLPNPLPRSIRRSIRRSWPRSTRSTRSTRSMRTRALGPRAWTGVLLVGLVLGGIVYWRLSRRARTAHLAMEEHLGSASASEATGSGPERVGAR